MKQKVISMFLALLFSPFCTGQEEERPGPVLPFEVPSQNLLKYNRYLGNPTFSVLGEMHNYVSFHHRNQWADYDDSPQVYLLSYSGKINDRTGFGLGVFQQRHGVIDNFGVLANYSRRIQLAYSTYLTFGLNMAYYRSGINRGNVFLPDEQDPALQYAENSSLLAIHPGINLSFGSFDAGVYAENMVNVNLATYKSYPEQGGGRVLSFHLMHTLKLDRMSGAFENGTMAMMLRGRNAEDSFYPGGSLIVDFPRLGWLQGGYDKLYGAAAGIGINLTSSLSLGYTVEQGLSEFMVNFGTSHEFGLSYVFKPPEPSYVPSKRKRTATVPVVRKPREQLPDTTAVAMAGPVADKEQPLPESGEEKAVAPPRIAADSLKTEIAVTPPAEPLPEEVRITEEEEQAEAPPLTEPEAVAAVTDTLVKEEQEPPVPVVPRHAPDIEDMLFTAAAKQENIRAQTASLLKVDDGYYIIANVFKNEANLKKYIGELKEKGWEADSFKNPENELNYVYVKRYDSWEEAINQRKKHARELKNNAVWVFRVRNADSLVAQLESTGPVAGILTDKTGRGRNEAVTAPENENTGRGNALNLPLAGGDITSSVRNTYIPVDIIESVPIFPGCEDLRNNEERKACLANGIDKVIQRRFRASVATGLGLSGIQGVYVEFKVGTDGEVDVMRIRAPHRRLEEEARRVIGHIPKMIPGRQGNTPVDVMYSKAIIIKLE
ncbi:PorP/SprF family type IX secretion system membrane protein [Sinomicrobium soli]|uniref:PorP/SprF family type IX secretion system membrane protein n=1 Tax=Sinomicrobium sp. N-1-3-6 TaxID=2219864 RepID=UPI000DCF534F|nr:PorP/SprF family type IX secretion system membrane protein [Sinomicrobium sp. N-1-3-6]RAV29669.1 hypothetical protein DN748_06000 [Sinomicrobium sp. N-1-3-6]